MKTIAIIPARYASTRFPGKPLAIINGKPMVQHVYERCNEVFTHTYVATDDQRIANCIEGFKGHYVMTSSAHQSGTDRCAEAAKTLAETIEFDIVVNVQGDEPFISQEHLLKIQDCFDDVATEIATLVTPIETNELLFDSNKVKACISTNNFALYFSRQAIPYQRDNAPENWLNHSPYYLHLGIYAFKKEVLSELTKLPSSTLEKAEQLEQLRWLENGYSIKVAVTKHSTKGIDTPEDLKALTE